jgi:hypothetical protein
VNKKKYRHPALSSKQFGAKKCSETLLPANMLLVLVVMYRKTSNAKNVTGNTQTHSALLVRQRLQTKNPSKAASVRLKSHSLASIPDNERA